MPATRKSLQNKQFLYEAFFFAILIKNLEHQTQNLANLDDFGVTEIPEQSKAKSPY
jgi:hypothetical protein